MNNFDRCIEACFRCMRECERCADGCLGSEHLSEMSECIKLHRDCAQMCFTAAAAMSRGSRFIEEACHLCADICVACAAECWSHEESYCRRCAHACETCTEECRRVVAGLEHRVQALSM